MSEPIEDHDPGDEQTPRPEYFTGWKLRETKPGWWQLSRDQTTLEASITWPGIGVTIMGSSAQSSGLYDFPPVAGVERLLELRRTAIAEASARA